MQSPPARAAAPRHNQWTRPKMVAFLRELAASQSVTQAAKSVGMSRQSAYRLRNAMKGTPFDLGWETALEMGFGQLAQAVMDRAVNGEEVQHFWRGELVATTRRYDNHLARWVLDNPWKVGRHQVAREYTGQAFDRLLERIEAAGLDWEAGDVLPGKWIDHGAEPDDAREAEDKFFAHESWYGALARETAGKTPGRR